MLIVSKEEDKIVNFDEIQCIEFLNPLDKGCVIFANLSDDTIDLGEYKTEEECKGILRDIINYYCNGKKVFYMPEE